MNYSISILDCNTGKLTNVYDFTINIKDIEDIDLLAQLAMSRKKDNELVVIMPGWNRSIKDNPEEYNRALELENKYKEYDEYDD